MKKRVVKICFPKLEMVATPHYISFPLELFPCEINPFGQQFVQCRLNPILVHERFNVLKFAASYL
ncbi:hypothetical protein ACFLV3_01475 [Chloroflexota bacterium]